MFNIKNHKIRYVIPQAVTLLATVSSLTAIKTSLSGDWSSSIFLMIIAALADGLDGRIARLFNASSKFGENLDSLSDFVAFGVCPSFIMYFWILNEGGLIGWIITLFFICCCGLRLARFNSKIGSNKPYMYAYFQGVPAPAGALLLIFPIALSMLGQKFSVEINIIWVILISILIISNIPTFSFKRINRLYLIILFIICMFLYMYGLRFWGFCAVVCFAYLLTFPFSTVFYIRDKSNYNKLNK